MATKVSKELLEQFNKAIARMLVPKLVSEVSDAPGFCPVAGVDGCLSCEKHDDDAKLSVKSDFG